MRGRVQAARETGSGLPFVGGGGCSHGTAVADVVALGGVGVAVTGFGVEASVEPFLGEGEGDMGRRWHTCSRSGEREWRGRGPGEFWRRLGARQRCEWGLPAGEVP